MSFKSRLQAYKTMSPDDQQRYLNALKILERNGVVDTLESHLYDLPKVESPSANRSVSQASQPEIIRFAQNMTLRWQCLPGDFILWIGYDDLLADSPSIKVRDFWEMRAGQRVVITNRTEDLPSGFQLHHSEVCNLLALKMVIAMGRGEKPFSVQPMVGPNLWRVKAGDFVAWVGNERADRASVDGILAVIECEECNLVAGESEFSSLEEFIALGSPTEPANPENIRRGHAAVEFVKKLGLPRTWGREWQLG